jgi:hypothetical protein
MLISILISFFLHKLIIRFMIKKKISHHECLWRGIICLKKFNMKSLWIQTIRIYSILWQLVFWINAKLGGYYLCLDFDLSSYNVLGTNKGNLMCCPVTHTLHIRKEMQPTNNNVMSFSSLTIFYFKHYQ